MGQVPHRWDARAGATGPTESSTGEDSATGLVGLEHEDPQVVRLVFGVRAPDLSEQLLADDDKANMPYQGGQKPVLGPV